jgi:uncharacterized protein (DUF885 family)
MRTLVYHEAVPGHHFQVALQQENTGLPRYRRDRVFGVGSAYGEGWALYAEQLASENGWYGDDVVGNWGSWMRNCSAPAAWWWTPACTR